jgi:hypothetical protein
MKAIKFTERIAELATQLSKDSRVYADVAIVEIESRTAVITPGDHRLLTFTNVKARDIFVDEDGDLIISWVKANRR